ncbi:MAG: hypothetical protein EXX96DRAFT_568274 [Benjaminiella poitrasii]|nr:MAG: hypothetical protein EXX96DRAFT_568274 [Benjaminiella poitrasii]
MAPRGKKKVLDTTTNTKIDSYFKPIAKQPLQKEKEASTKRKITDIDENTSRDEANKKTPSPPNSQSLKSHESKRGPLAELEERVRIPLMDKNPNKPSGISQKSRKNKTKEFIQPAFAVLCDEDIERGIEKADTPPSISHLFKDESSLNNSQESNNSSNSDQPQLELNTQFISEGDMNTQMTAVTSSPVPFDESDEEKSFVVYNDEDNEFFGDEIRSSGPAFEVYQDESEEPLSTVDTNENIRPLKPHTRDDNKENELPTIADEVNDSSSDDLDIPQTKQTAVALKKPSKNERSLSFDHDFSFFGDADDDDEGSNTNSTYFELEKEHEQENGAPIIAELDGDFSVGDLPTSNDIFSIPIDSKNKETLQESTLSPEVQSFGQIHVALPNPRGKDILEKYNINESKQESSIENYDNEDEDDDGLPIF